MTNQLQLDRRGNLNFECPLIPAGIGSGQHMKHHFRQVLGGCLLKKVASYAYFFTHHGSHFPPGEVPEGAVGVVRVKKLGKDEETGGVLDLVTLQCGSWNRRCP